MKCRWGFCLRKEVFMQFIYSRRWKNIKRQEGNCTWYMLIARNPLILSHKDFLVVLKRKSVTETAVFPINEMYKNIKTSISIDGE